MYAIDEIEVDDQVREWSRQLREEEKRREKAEKQWALRMAAVAVRDRFLPEVIFKCDLRRVPVAKPFVVPGENDAGEVVKHFVEFSHRGIAIGRFYYSPYFHIITDTNWKKVSDIRRLFVETLESVKWSGTKPGERCEWELDAETGMWATQCGKLFLLEDMPPQEYGMNFCPYCGRELVVKEDYEDRIDTWCLL